MTYPKQMKGSEIWIPCSTLFCIQFTCSMSFQDDPPFLSWRWEAEPTFSAIRKEVGFGHGLNLNDLWLLVNTAGRAQMATYL